MGLFVLTAGLTLSFILAANESQAGNDCTGKFGVKSDGTLKCSISTKNECARDCFLGIL